MPKRSACLIKSASARGTGSLAAHTAPRASHASVAREALRANKRETLHWPKFALDDVGERTHGYAFTDTAFSRYWT
ncbi:hypothetical protein [Pseudovibrio sp. Tun.PSC04-5.I4]|uniref:hypothetical protein n=1 Tax=Pseudovibrio sp. Tun.PSC04-5.I4 TaxID=1798213 RepID=UPI00087FBF9D|nr:hypothetical protein [Pseudovibrio sp. Tun.PSC04-5.I4]SDR45196.1 hypothetical protein SAMN04515695_5520 [Pseudovibrio sp. Tun.PSC04-5.I4]